MKNQFLDVIKKQEVMLSRSTVDYFTLLISLSREKVIHTPSNNLLTLLSDIGGLFVFLTLFGSIFFESLSQHQLLIMTVTELFRIKKGGKAMN